MSTVYKQIVKGQQIETQQPTLRFSLRSKVYSMYLSIVILIRSKSPYRKARSFGQLKEGIVSHFEKRRP